MSRVDRHGSLSRLRRTPSLDRLEERQLLSTLSASHPASSIIEQPNVQIGRIVTLSGSAVPSAFYVPAQMKQAYGVNQVTQQGQGMTIAIVDAFSQPNIVSDLSIFSNTLGLPQMDGVGSDPKFSIMTPTGQTTPGLPPSNAPWGVEISLDVEWAHSIAPYANIDLIECQDAGGDSLFAAEVDGQPFASGVGFAKSLPGVAVVSNSYGTGEFNGETDYDSEFTTPNNNVSFVYSTGDSGAPGEYPAYSPNAIAVGGTSLETLSIKGNYGKEIGWNGSGGGISHYESTPAFQSSNGVNFGARSIPDVSMDADPTTGVVLYDSYDYGSQFVVGIGGTSLAAPMWAGLIALGDQAHGSNLDSHAILSDLYSAYNSANYSTDFHDVTTGNNGHAAGVGYDLVTGIGSPKAPGIVSLLGSSASPAVLGGQPGGGGLPGQGSAPTPGVVSAATTTTPSASTVTASNLLAVGTVTNVVTTMDIAKPKASTSLLAAE
jgi:subtilase family serine protease